MRQELKFPLRLTPFEEYFLLAHRKEYPSTFCFELTFDRVLSRETVETAVEFLCKLHPFSNRTVTSRNGKYFWSEQTQTLSPVWHDSEFDLTSLRIDVTCESPLKIIMSLDREGCSKLHLLVHHVAFDGLGAIQWLSDFVTVCRSLQSENRLPDLERDSRLLAGRCRPGLRFTQWLRLLPAQWHSVRETFRVLRRRPIPAAATDELTSIERPNTPGFISFELSPDETRQLRRYAVSSGSSLNTLAIRELLLGIESWQRSGQKSVTGTHYRIVVPINERQRSQRKMASCNHCTMINLDFEPVALRQPEQLRGEIAKRMDLITRWRLSLNFWRVLGLFRRLPGGLNRAVQTDRVPATALLTNIGRVFQKFTNTSSKGDILAVRDFRGYPPLQRGMQIAIGMYQFNNELRVAAQYDRRALSHSDVANLMHRFKSLLKSDASEVQA